jgi:DNA helicase-2/ATP-dependent DNA helicase PcrA
MDLLLDDERRRILEADDHVLVTGGPGCGKTTIALAKAERKVAAGLATGQSVLFLSFSRSAVARLLEASKILLVGEAQHRLSVQTFHSFFWDILQGFGYLLGAPKRLKILLPHDERALRKGAEEEDDQWRAQREQLFSEEGRVVFDLFAPKTHELLQRCSKLRALLSSRHPLIVVDEAQDTAEDQWQCIRLLSERSQLICLADLEQQIYDFRPGVSAERLTHIIAALEPQRVDLMSANHRSPAAEIVAFGNDILAGTPRGRPYKGISKISFRPDRAHRDIKIRLSVGIIGAKVRRTAGHSPESIALLATWGRGVNVIAKALGGDSSTPAIPHRVLIDEAPVFLSSRLVAFLLEPRADNGAVDLAEALELAAAVFRAQGSASSIGQAERLSLAAATVREGRALRARSLGVSMADILARRRAHMNSGDPRRDWLDARSHLASGGSPVWEQIAEYAEQLVVLQRGHQIANRLTELWQTQGSYAGARGALDTALAQEQMLDGATTLRGITVMTMHKAKGKEFDAVIIVDDAHSCPLVRRDEEFPHAESRKLLRVGITRARHHVLLLTDVSSPCPLLEGHVL